MELKQKIRTARKEANLSQQELSEAIGVSDKAVSAYEVGRSSPSIRVLEKISAATSKPLSYFLQDKSRAATTEHVLMTLNRIEQELNRIRVLLEKAAQEEEPTEQPLESNQA